MADFKAIADAIAVRFSAANITPPSGETDIQESTASLPDAIHDEPTVLVFPPSSIDLSYGPSVRKALANYPVRFYLYKVRDTPRNSELLNNWIQSLYDQTTGQVHLGLSSYVNKAVVTEIAVGPLTYGQTEYHGIELTVEVLIGEGLAAVA